MRPRLRRSRLRRSRQTRPRLKRSRSKAPKVEPAKVEPIKVEAAKADTSKPEAQRFPGKLLIMSPGDRAWDGRAAGAKPEAGASGEAMPGKRRMSAMVAVVGAGDGGGTLGGALATAGLGHMAGTDTAAANSSALEASVARIDADMVALESQRRTTTAKTGVSQFNKTSDRLDKVEKAQAEPRRQTRQAQRWPSTSSVRRRRRRLSWLRPRRSRPRKSRDRLSPPANRRRRGSGTTRKSPGLPTCEGWCCADVGNGGALIEGRQGVYEVYAGDPVPGLGPRRCHPQAGRPLVVVTSKGLIVAR